MGCALRPPSDRHIQNRIAERLDRWRRFLAPEAKPGRMVLVRCTEGFGPRPWPNPDNFAARIEWAWRKYQLDCAQLAWLDDDHVPFLEPYTGTELFAEAFGCGVHRPGNDMPSALALVSSAEEAANLRVPSLNAPPLAGLFAIADELRRRAGPDALVRLPDIQSPLDIAALIWKKEKLYEALAEEPEAVEALVDKTEALLTNFLDAWFERYGVRCIAHYPEYVMSGGITLSEDEIGTLSTGMFARFVRPRLERLSRRYGGIGIHCCAHARHQWPGLADISELRLLNLHQPPQVLAEAYRFFAERCAQYHFPQEGVPVPADVRAVFCAEAPTREEALQKLAQLRAG